ncbi:MAG TPA: response regulator [Clostridiales bacterium]|nr:response regulator [Clostridiales bacterium]
MFSILIVDDETLIRKALKTLINWEQLGFKLIADVYNGIEALKIIDSCHVDIVLTDLKMPEMDGLELMRNVIKKYPHIKFIALSAYDEFHMVSEAFKLGAKEYFLKSEMEEDDIVKAIQNIKTEIERDKLEELHKKKIRDEMKSSGNALKQEILLDIVMRNRIATDRELKLLNDRYLPAFNPENMRVMHINIGKYLKLEDKIEVYNYENIKNNIYNAIKQKIEEYTNVEILYRYPDEIILICSFSNLVSKRQLINEFLGFFSDINNYIYKKYNLKITAGLSGYGRGYNSLNSLYIQALTASEHSFIFGKGKLLIYSNLPINNKSVNIEKHQKPMAFRDLLKTMDADRISRGYVMFVQKPEDASCKNIIDIKIMFQQYYFIVMEFTHHVNIIDNINELAEEYEKYLRDMGDLLELNNWLKRLMQKIAETLENTSNLILSLKKYIHQNYSQNIVLSDVAEKYSISTCYLSRVFAEEVGCNFAQYLSKVRIEAAIDLLINTNLKIYEIAERVGYSNSEHFSRSFKKIIGKSPKTYSR